MREHGSDERRSLVEFLLHLAEIDRRRDYEHFDKSTLWQYVHEGLGYPECQTFARTTCVRLLREYPQVTGYLLDGRLSMSTLVELRHALSPGKVDDLLAQAAGKSKREVRELVSAMNAPVAPVAEIRDLPPGRVVEVSPEVLALRNDAAALLAAAGLCGDGSESAGTAPETPSGSDAAAASGESARVSVPEVPAGKALLVMGAPEVSSVRPVSATQRELRVTISAEFEQDLRELGEILSHSIGRNDYAGQLAYCVKKQLEVLRKRQGRTAGDSDGARKEAPATEPSSDAPDITSERVSVRDAGASVGGTGTPPARENERDRRRADQPKPSRDPLPDISAALHEISKRRVHIPLKLQRLVRERAGHACEWLLKSGKRCRSKHRCQLDHIKPIGKEGRTELSNLRLLCQAHNLEAARRTFGDELVDRCIARSRANSAKPSASGRDAAGSRDPPS